MLSSIISLAWSFTAHKAIYKDGALDLTVSPVSRVVLCASDLLLILSRLNFIILFMYYFGPGIFFPGVIFLIFHSLLMILLHMIFEKTQGTLICSNGFAEVCTEVHTCLLNGLANMFSNNGRIIIESEKQKNKERTFKRHMSYDLFFLVENIVLAVFGLLLSLEDPKQQEAKNYTLIVSMISHLIGLLLKALYYAKLHVWSDLILRKKGIR